MLTYFTTTMTLDEGKQTYRLLSRQFHPDLGGDADLMVRLNTEWQQFQDAKNGKAPRLGATPTTTVNVSHWWQSVVAAAHQTVPPSPTPQKSKTSRSSTPRQSAASREEADYQEARQQPMDAHGHRVFGSVTILWQGMQFSADIEAVEVKGASPRHQVRVNGQVEHEQPATRAWKRERTQIIARAKNWTWT